MGRKSIPHIVAYGHLNFLNQVYLLLYKSFTRVVRPLKSICVPCALWALAMTVPQL